MDDEGGIIGCFHAEFLNAHFAGQDSACVYDMSSIIGSDPAVRRSGLGINQSLEAVQDIL